MKKLTLSFLVLLFAFTLAPQSAEAALCKVGDQLQVHWGSKWWPARVTAVNAAGNKCKIHYKGYEHKWDEWVGADRIRTASSGGSKASASSRAYYVGKRVKVLWNGKWWNAKVLRVKNNKYYIKYDGYGSKWNEWVGNSRIRSR